MGLKCVFLLKSEKFGCRWFFPAARLNSGEFQRSGDDTGRKRFCQTNSGLDSFFHAFLPLLLMWLSTPNQDKHAEASLGRGRDEIFYAFLGGAGRWFVFRFKLFCFVRGFKAVHLHFVSVFLRKNTAGRKSISVFLPAVAFLDADISLLTNHWMPCQQVKETLFTKAIYVPAHKCQCSQMSGNLLASTAHGQTLKHDPIICSMRGLLLTDVLAILHLQRCVLFTNAASFSSKKKTRIQMNTGSVCWSGTAEQGTCSVHSPGRLWIFIFLSPHKHTVVSLSAYKCAKQLCCSGSFSSP